MSKRKSIVEPYSVAPGLAAKSVIDPPWNATTLLNETVSAFALSVETHTRITDAKNKRIFD
jgi:hypothetical protein